MDKDNLFTLVIAIVVAVAAVGALVALDNDDSDESKNSIVIHDGESLTQEQLNALQSVAQSDTRLKLTFKTSEYTVVFDNKAISNIQEVADLALVDVDPSTLPADVQSTLGADAKVIDVSFGNNKNFGEGTVTVSIPYTVPEGQEAANAVAVYVADDGNLECVPLEISKGKATFTLHHFSKYAIAYADEKYTMAHAGLKVFGNVNGDNFINAEDVTEIKALVESGLPLAFCPIADANQDGVLNADDVAAVQAVVDALADPTFKTKATIWHYNYHDADKDGVMDEELVSTVIPTNSAITTGSANTFMMLYMLGITTEIKGASYGSGNDAYLYGDYYLNKKVCVQLGTSSMSIKFEDGKAGSSDVIAEQNVTLLLSDWNRSYIENEADFEKAKVDVVRIAAASFEPEVYTHSISLLGLVFNKVDNASRLVASYDATYETIKELTSTIAKDDVKKVVASSTNGSVSSENSDYTAFCVAAGAEFGLKGYDFGGSASIAVADNLGVFDTRKYSFDNIVHIRTALTYNSSAKEVAEYWSTYSNAMSKWEHAYDGQVLISGAAPVPVRVALIAYAIYGESFGFTEEWADGVHSEFASLYEKDIAKAPNQTLLLTTFDYAVSFTDDLVVTQNGSEITSGAKFKYGTTLNVSVKAGHEKAGFVILASGTTVGDNGDFVVSDTISIRYVDPAVLQALSTVATNLSNGYSGFYLASSTANGDGEGSVTTVNTYYNGTDKTYTFYFTYYDDEADAAAAYAALAEKVASKKKTVCDTSALVGEGKLDGMALQYTSSGGTPDGKAYIGSTAYFAAYQGHIVVDGVNKYVGNYSLDSTTDYFKDATKRDNYFADQAAEFATAIANAFSA